MTCKSYDIPKTLVWEAWLHVKANQGAAGIDAETIERFETKLAANLYKLWNRMSSGSYFPPPVKAVPIPKKSGGVRVLGIPTVSDRIAQTAIKMWLEPQLDPLFHDDSYGYRPGKSALEAIAVTRRRCWDQDWVVEFDIRGLFDNLDHGLLMTALRKHCQEPWILLYVERWLKAPMQSADGQLQVRDKGTPQGGVVSPILANLFLHYAFDLWVTRHLPGVRFARYADDAVLHCKSRRQAEYVLERIRERFQACNLELHPGKTRIVYCKDINRTEANPDIQFTFLGYTFRPRKAVDKYGRVLCELLAGRQPRRPQGDAADDPGMADPTEERQEPGRSFGHARTDPEGMAAILRPFPRLGAEVGLAAREPVPDRMADAQAQEAGGPQNAGRRNAQTAGATPATRIRPLADGLPVVGWMMGAG